jgi:hypothetical protein
LNVPGSDSSALQIVYFGCGSWLATISHFWPVGKPAPPMPRRPESFSVATIDSGRRLAGQRAAQEPVALGPGLVGVVRAALVVAAQRLGLLVLAGAGGGDGGVGLAQRQRALVDGRGRARRRSAPGTETSTISISTSSPYFAFVSRSARRSRAAST